MAMSPSTSPIGLEVGNGCSGTCLDSLDGQHGFLFPQRAGEMHSVGLETLGREDNIFAVDEKVIGELAAERHELVKGLVCFFGDRMGGSLMRPSLEGHVNGHVGEDSAANNNLSTGCYVNSMLMMVDVAKEE
jgi:hypothetical protein